LKPLMTLAGLNVLLYAYLAWSFPLLALAPQSRLTLYNFSQSDPLLPWRLTGVFVALLGLYGSGWYLTRRVCGGLAWLIVLGSALTSAGVLLWLYPFGAADIFDNIMHGRILGVYGANPFLYVPQQFPTDPFYAYVAWLYTPSMYGPGWEALAGIAARLAGDGVLANVLAFKLIDGFFWAGSIGLVVLILRQVAPQRALAGVTLLAWNPVILYETWGQGHNDIAVAFWLLAGVWLLARRRYTLAVLALVGGALVKFIPALLLPAAGWVAWRNLSSPQDRLRFVILTATLSAALVMVAYWPFWQGLDVLNLPQRSQQFTASLPAMVYHGLARPWWGLQTAARLVSLTAAGATLLFALGQARWIDPAPAWLGFSRAALKTLMFYLLLTCLWFQEWYVIWPLSLAAVLPAGPMVYLTLAFGGYVLPAKHFIFGPLFFWLQPLPPRSWLEPRFSLAVMGLPWLCALYAGLKQGQKLLHAWRNGRHARCQR
jgi:hypothetical protein